MKMDDLKKPFKKTGVDIPERLITIALSAFLLLGSAALHIRNSRPLNAITVENNGLEEELTLSQVEKKLKEARRVSINTAASQEITVIPGIGEVIASRIVEFREKYGKFRVIEDLLKIRGIGPVKLENIKEYVRIE